MPDSAADNGQAAETPAGQPAAADLHRARMATLGELTAGIAHDLATPIAYLGSNLDALRRHVEAVSLLIAQAESFIAPEHRVAWRQALAAARWSVIGEDLRAVVDESREGAEHVRNLIGELKTLARTSPAPEPGSIDHCVISALTILTHELRNGCRIERDLACQASLPLVRSQIIQLVINLVHNAVQAVAVGGRIRVSTRMHDAVAGITVEDDGPGVPPHQWQEVFQPFHTGRTGGTGLGLSIVARIARDHGGGVRLDRSPTLGGARFTVDLRRWQGEVAP